MSQWNPNNQSNQKRKWKLSDTITAAVITALATIIVALIGLVKSGTIGASSAVITPTPSPVVNATITVSPTATSTPRDGSSPAATPTDMDATPPSGAVTFNLPLSPVRSDYSIGATLISITPYQGNLVWTFSFTDRGVYVFDQGYFYTSLLTIEDSTGTSYPIVNSDTWNIAAAGSATARLTTQGIPPHGTHLSLTLAIDGDYDSSSALDTYATTPIPY